MDEPVPTTAPQPTVEGGAVATNGASPAELASGTFVSRKHATQGTARILRLSDDREVVRLERLPRRTGRSWWCGCRRTVRTDPGGAFDDAHLDLGPPKGNVGSQNYAVPAGADTASYARVVVWCARFHVPFGAADLTAGPER